MLPNPAISYPASSIIWVAMGGAVGSVLRFTIGEAARRWSVPAAASSATLLVNVLGALALGLILRWAISADPSPTVRAFLVVGLCGGFTTFSAFSLEAASMLSQGHALRAVAYAVTSVALSVGAVFAGFAIAGVRS